MEVSELTRRAIVACAASAPVSDVTAIMRDQNVGCVVLMDDHGHIAGIVTDRDIALRGGQPDQKVIEVASLDVVYVYEHDDIFNAATRMATTGRRRLPILDALGTPKGMVTLDDLLVLFGRQIEKLSRAVGKELAAPPVS